MSHIVDGGWHAAFLHFYTSLADQRAWLAATAFKEGCRDLAQQAATLSAEVKKLQASTKDAVPLEVRDSSVYGAECHV